MKKLASLAISLLLGALLAGCGAEQNAAPAEAKQQPSTQESGAIAKIKERGKLVVGVKTDFPPFGYLDQAGKPAGFEIALAKRFAKDLLGDESKIELVPVTGPNRVPYLQSDKVDMVIATMNVSPEREQVIDFTNPHFKTPTGVLVKKDSPIQSQKDLAGKKVIVVKGSTGDGIVSKQLADSESVKFANNTEALQALQDERGDAYIQEFLMLHSWVKKNPDYQILDENFPAIPWAPAVKEGNTELRDWINQDLEKLGEEKFLHKLYDEYLKEELGTDLNPDDFVVEGGKL